MNADRTRSWNICAHQRYLRFTTQQRELLTSQKYKTDIPPDISIPNTIETRLGTLTFTDSFPDDATVQRGVRAFLTAMPVASLSAMREGLRSIGVTRTTTQKQPRSGGRS